MIPGIALASSQGRLRDRPGAPRLSLAPSSNRGPATDTTSNEPDPWFVFDLDARTQAGDYLILYDNGSEIWRYRLKASDFNTGITASAFPSFENGSHPLTARVLMESGLSKASDTLTYVLDRSLGTITAGVAGTDMTVGLGSASPTAGDTIEIKDRINGVVYVSYTVLAGDVSGGSATIDISGLQVGNYDVMVSLYDDSGNFSAAVNDTFTLS